VTSRIAAALLLGCFALTACGRATTQPASPPSAAPEADIVASGSGVTLGSGWYPLEHYGGQTFRWVDDRAQFTIDRPAASGKTVSFDVEAGPGIGKPSFLLHVRDRSGHDVASQTVNGRERVAFELPVRPNVPSAFELRPSGGGKSTPHENRILNFRVFAIDDRPSLAVATEDIVSQSDVHLGANWDPLEHFEGKTFRWVDNDAGISIDAAQSGRKTLALDVSAGPAIVQPGDFAISLRDASGKTIATTRVRAAGTASFDVPLRKGTNAFSLHVATTGRSAPGDTRVLDFRVFTFRVF
jgi:hypothetical protein